MNDQPERVIYKGGPAQVVNFRIFMVCAIIFIAAILAPTLWNIFFAASYSANLKKYYMILSKALFFVPIIWAFAAWLKVRSHQYIITTERLKEEEGVFSKTVDELELFRVKDISFVQPFSLRMFGCGNIVLDTSDKSTPIVVLHALKNPAPVIELLRTNVAIMRTKKGVREID